MRAVERRLVLALGALLLGGCSLVPTYQVPAVAMPAGYEGSAAPAAAMPAAFRKPRRSAATADSSAVPRSLMFCVLMFDAFQVEWMRRWIGATETVNRAGARS